MAETLGNSDASAWRDSPHSSMIARKEVKSDMDRAIGQLVLKIKAVPSLDSSVLLGQNVRMPKSREKPLTKYDLEFLARTFAAREAARCTQGELAAKLGGMTQDRYKQYEVRSPLPHALIDAFCTITKVDYAYLFAGKGEGPAWRERYQTLLEREKAKKPSKRAA